MNQLLMKQLKYYLVNPWFVHSAVWQTDTFKFPGCHNEQHIIDHWTIGPIIKKLDKALASFNVERQAYHGGAFVGNHMNRALKVFFTHSNFILFTNVA